VRVRTLALSLVLLVVISGAAAAQFMGPYACGHPFHFCRRIGIDRIQVLANGMLPRSIPVRSTDLDGDGATDLQDLHAFRERFLFHTSAPETDFNRDGTTDIRDFALLRDECVRKVRGTVWP